MDIRQLELLAAVVELASVTRAAERMHLSPGAISLQLHNMAAELKTELFVRTGRNLIPTPAGLRLAEQGRVLIRQMRELEQEFASDPGSDMRPFHFATGAATLIYRLGKPLRRLRREYPKTPLELTVAPTEEIVAGLLDRRFDLGLISLPYPHEGLRIIPLFDEELLLLKPSSKSVTGWHVHALEVGELANAPFVLYPERSNMRQLIRKFFEGLNIQLRVVTEADDTEALKHLVEAGFGYSILPEVALRRSPRFFETYRIKGHKLVRTQALAVAKSQYPRALTESILMFLRKALTDS